MMEWDDLGIRTSSGSGKTVCAQCIEDPNLQEFVNANLFSELCDYCGKTANTLIAAEFNELIEHMARFVNQEWTDPANELPYDGREGGYQGAVLDGRDLMEEIGFEVENLELLNDVCDAFNGRVWCKIDAMAASPSERQRLGWDRFCDVVRHRRRFTFWTDHADEGESEFHPDYLPPSLMLDEIGEAIASANMIKDISKGTAYWRVRVHRSVVSISNAEDLTPPPLHLVNQPNRMSPAGVPMFYGALDWDTCCAEVVDPDNLNNRAITGGVFTTLKDIKVLDLTRIPHAPSYFSEGGADQQHLIAFLHYFASDISKPIKRDKRQHIEYVPTQVFTEFVRYELAPRLNHPVHGILYRSSRNRGTCCVLFASQEECLPSTRPFHEQVLEFDETSLRTEDAKTPDRQRVGQAPCARQSSARYRASGA